MRSANLGDTPTNRDLIGVQTGVNAATTGVEFQRFPRYVRFPSPGPVFPPKSVILSSPLHAKSVAAHHSSLAMPVSGTSPTPSASQAAIFSRLQILWLGAKLDGTSSRSGLSATGSM